MTAIDEPYAAARFASLSDRELVDIVENQRDDYTERAIELALAELARRGVDPASLLASETSDGARVPVVRSQSLRGLGERWLDLYTSLLFMSAVAAPLAHLFILSSDVWTLVVQLPVSCFQGAVAYGLKKRRAWGWYLNWVALLVVCAVATSRGGLVGAILWFVLNTVYFANRRRLFELAPSAN